MWIEWYTQGPPDCSSTKPSSIHRVPAAHNNYTTSTQTFGSLLGANQSNTTEALARRLNFFGGAKHAVTVALDGTQRGQLQRVPQVTQFTLLIGELSDELGGRGGAAYLGALQHGCG